MPPAGCWSNADLKNIVKALCCITAGLPPSCFTGTASKSGSGLQRNKRGTHAPLLFRSFCLFRAPVHIMRVEQLVALLCPQGSPRNSS